MPLSRRSLRKAQRRLGWHSRGPRGRAPGSPEVLSAALFVTAPSPRNSLPSDAQGEEGEAVFFPFFLFLKKVNK